MIQLNRLFNNKRGTEKPIEIFLALFIILAVSMVMLKMFKGQISEQTQEMEEISRQQELEDSIKDTTLECKELCSAAIDDRCSLRKIATYCVKQVGNIMDIGGSNSRLLDFDQNMGIDFNSELLGGIGLCEDAIHCPLIGTCVCGRELTPEYCKEKLCDYWTSAGLNATDMLHATFKVDSNMCMGDPDYNANIMWNRNIVNATC